MIRAASAAGVPPSTASGGAAAADGLLHRGHAQVQRRPAAQPGKERHGRVTGGPAAQSGFRAA